MLPSHKTHNVVIISFGRRKDVETTLLRRCVFAGLLSIFESPDQTCNAAMRLQMNLQNKPGTAVSTRLRVRPAKSQNSLCIRAD